MTEEKIRQKIKNQEYISWFDISWRKNLSEDFIREFSDKICWCGIFSRQKLSENFIREFSSKLYLHIIPFCYFNFKKRCHRHFL